MKGNELILQTFQEMDLYSMTEQMIIDTKNHLLENVNISNLEKEVKKAILKLSGVGQPSLGADAVYIALDNQARLDIIYQLLNTFELFKIQTRNLKRNRYNCNTDNFEYVFDYLSRTQNLFKTIYNYAEFQYKEKMENQKAIVEHNIKYLEDHNKRGKK